jgi:PAS domain S-box-containing protein
MRVLIVDDIEINRKVLTVTLKSAGQETVEAEDGIEALARLRESKIDAIISDILMPRMDGYRLCYEVRLDAKFRDLPFIVYSSSYTSDADERLAMDVGADLFIRKPASPEAILEALTRVTKNRRPPVAHHPPGKELDSLREYSTGLVRKLELNNKELLEAQKELAASHAELQRRDLQIHLLLDSTVEGIWAVDRQGNFTFCNAVAIRLFRYRSIADLTGKHAHELVHYAHADGTPYAAEECPIERALQHGQDVHIDSEVFWRADKTSFPVEYRGHPILDRGEIVGAVVTFLDITDRKRAQEALRTSEERLRIGLNTANIAIFNQDLDLRYVWMFQPQLGYSPEEVVGHTDAELLPAETAERVMEIKRRVLNSGLRERAEVSVKIGDRTLFYELIVEPLRDANGALRGLTGASLDITDRKQAQEALRQSEERFRGAFESSAIGFALVAPDGRWLQINHSLCEITGYSEKELQELTFQDITHPDDLAEDLSFVHRVLAREISSYQMEKRYIHKAGHVVWVHLSVSLVRDAHGSPFYFVSQVKDITDKKRAEEELRSSETRYRALMEHARDAIFVTDMHGFILEANLAAEALFGGHRTAMTGKHFFEMISPEERPAVGSDFEQVRKGAKLEPRRTLGVRADGSRVAVEASAALVEVSGSSLVLAIVRDVSAR